MKNKVGSTNILLYCLFLFIPMSPYFMPNKICYNISWYLYMALGLICLGLFVSLIFAIVRYVILLALFHQSKKDTSEDKLILIKWIKRSLILLGLSTIGYLGGSTVLIFTQMNKFNNVIKKVTLFEKENGRKPIDLEEINLDDQVVNSRLNSIKYSQLNIESDKCIGRFTYMTDIYCGSDLNCEVVCCKGKPSGPPFKFIANGYGDCKWYRFCSF